MTTSGYTLDDNMICGESLDHDERITYEDEETTQYECARCGAEWYEDKESA